MFVFLEQFPLALPMSILTLVVLWIFFVAGADAGTIVLGSLSTGGPQEPKRWIKLAWGAAMAVIAGILLVAGGLGALQSASVLFGVPFAFIMVLMCVSFLKHLRTETRGEDRTGQEDTTVADRREGVAARGRARAGPGVRGRGAGTRPQQAARASESRGWRDDDPARRLRSPPVLALCRGPSALRWPRGAAGGGEDEERIAGDQFRLSGTQRDAQFTVGSDAFTEQEVLGAITVKVLEAADATVIDRTGLGGNEAVRRRSRTAR